MPLFKTVGVDGCFSPVVFVSLNILTEPRGGKYGTILIGKFRLANYLLCATAVLHNRIASNF